MSEKSEPTPTADAAPQQATQVVRQSAPVSVNINQLDEITAYLAAIRAPGNYNTVVPFAIVPDKIKVLDLEPHLPNPRRVKRHLNVVDADAFVNYINEFKIGHVPRLMSLTQDSGVSFQGIIDYDIPASNALAPVVATKQQPSGVEKIDLPQWGSHLITLTMAYSQDYAELKRNADQWHEQEDFALFLEENTHLFIAPTGADLLELAQELRGSKNVAWQSGKRLSNGQTKLEWTESATATTSGGDVVVPQKLVVNCPIFEGFAPEQFEAAFRWRIGADRSITFSYRLLTKLNERAAQEALKKKIADGTGITPYPVSTFKT